jgi:hypothetical protein
MLFTAPIIMPSGKIPLPEVTTRSPTATEQVLCRLKKRVKPLEASSVFPETAPASRVLESKAPQVTSASRMVVTLDTVAPT